MSIVDEDHAMPFSRTRIDRGHDHPHVSMKRNPRSGSENSRYRLPSICRTWPPWLHSQSSNLCPSLLDRWYRWYDANLQRGPPWLAYHAVHALSKASGDSGQVWIHQAECLSSRNPMNTGKRRLQVSLSCARVRASPLISAMRPSTLPWFFQISSRSSSE